MSLLPDVNIWLALSFSAHPHHLPAVEWFDDVRPASCAFCRMTQQGYLRLSSNPRVFGKDALRLSDAWKAYDVLLCDERVRFANEPAEVEASWRGLTARDEFSAKIWNDAYLAAFSLRGALKLVTFDKGFRQYPGLRLELLS